MTCTNDACPCGNRFLCDLGSSNLPVRVCDECGWIANRCATPGCENFAEHMAGIDERLWCDDHCPDCNETENPNVPES